MFVIRVKRLFDYLGNKLDEPEYERTVRLGCRELIVKLSIPSAKFI